MNDPLNNNQSQSTTPPSSAWTPQQAAPTIPPATAQPSSPFEAPPATNNNMPNSGGDGGPVMMEPAGPKNNTWLFVILGILILVGLGVAASMLNLFDFKKLIGQGKPTPTVTVSQTQAVVIDKNDDQRKADLANIKTALKQYYKDKQSYPIAPTLEKTSDQNSSLKSALVPNYLAELPVDPLSPTSFYGYKSPDGTSFELTAALETPDSSCVQTGSICLYKVTDTTFETPSSNPATGPDIDIIDTEEPTSNPTISTSSSSSSSSSSTSGSASANASADSDILP